MENTIPATERSGLTSISGRLAGSYIAIVAIVAVQFIDLSIFSISDYPVTLQKLALVLVLPISVGLMRRIAISGSLYLMAAVVLGAFISSLIFQTGELGLAFSTAATLLIQVAGAVIFLTALYQDKNNFRLCERAWVFFSVISAIVAIFQAVNILPLFTVHGSALADRQILFGHLVRATGFKFDPNFEGLMLSLGIGFAQGLRRYKTSITFILLCGVIATFSRAALLISVGILLIAPMIFTKPNRTFLKRLALGAALVLAIAVSITVLSAQSSAFERYINQRVDTLVSITVEMPTASSLRSHSSSAEARLLLAEEAWETFINHPLFGVGAHRLIDENQAALGISRAAHDSYLSLLATGGVFGLSACVLLITLFLRALLLLRRDQKSRLTTSALSPVIFGFFLWCFFLTLIYVFIFWFGVALIVYAIREALQNRRRLKANETCHIGANL